MSYTDRQLYEMTMRVSDLDGNELPDPDIVAQLIDSLRTTNGFFNLSSAKLCLSGVDNNGYDLYLSHNARIEPELHEHYSGLLLKITLAYARVYRIPWISIQAQDFIAPPSKTVRKNTWTNAVFARFAWEAPSRLGINSGCGNGIGENLYQYQIKGERYFIQDHFGVWDPKTETKISEFQLNMRSPRAVIAKLEWASNRGNKAIAKALNPL